MRLPELVQQGPDPIDPTRVGQVGGGHVIPAALVTHCTAHEIMATAAGATSPAAQVSTRA